jgi:hypothetical protein
MAEIDVVKMTPKSFHTVSTLSRPMNFPKAVIAERKSGQSLG